MKKANVLKQMLKKSTAVLSVAAMCVTAFAPVTYAAKQSPVIGSNLNFGVNEFENGVNGGTPWINKIQWTNPETNKEDGVIDSQDPEHNNIQYIGYNTGSPKEFATYYTTFNENYKIEKNVYEAEYPKYSMSFDFYLPQSEVAYKFMMQNREKVNVVKQDGAEDSVSAYIATFDILPGKDKAMIGLHKDSPQAQYNISPENCFTKELDIDKWYRARFDIDTVAETVSMFLDNEFVGTYDYGAYYDKEYQSYTPLSGLVSKTLIFGGTTGDGWVLDGYLQTDTPSMYFDNLSMDYIVDGTFYATGVVENNNIKVTLSETSKSNIDTTAIKVKKSDGTDVTIGNVFVNDKEITIPLTNREGGVEYVVSLPDGITDNNGNALYTNYVFVESPIKAADVEYLINEDFEGEVYTWTSTKKENLPKNSVANATNHQHIYTAYKNSDGSVSETAKEGANKVLKMKKLGTASSGIVFNFSSPAVSDFTVEYDFMTDFLSDQGVGFQMTANRGIATNSLNTVANGNPQVEFKSYKDGKDEVQKTDRQFVFGFTNADNKLKFGAPNYNSYDSNSKCYWSTTFGKGAHTYENTQTENVEANKWYHVKLDFKLTDKNYTNSKTKATVTEGETVVLDCEIPASINLYNGGQNGTQIQSIGFQTEWNAAKYLEDSGDGSTKDAYYPVSQYFDNLKVYSYNRTDNRVKTVTLNDVDGDDFGAVQTTSDNVISAKVQLATEKPVVGKTVTEDVIKVTDQDGAPVEFTFNGYDEETKSFDITFNKFLSKGKKYNLVVDGIYAINGTNGWGTSDVYLKLPAYTAQINVTDTGKPEVKAVFKLVDSEGNEVKKLTQDTQGVKITATIKNTTEYDTTAKAMLCEYQNGLLKNIIGEDIDVSAGNYKAFTSSEKYAIDTDTDAVKAFIWKDMSSFEPIAENKTIVK